jgi:hypothetical protein
MKEKGRVSVLDPSDFAASYSGAQLPGSHML